jgi:hypothetical protein
VRASVVGAFRAAGRSWARRSKASRSILEGWQRPRMSWPGTKRDRRGDRGVGAQDRGR